MARKKDPLDAQVHPSLREVGQVNAPIFLMLVNMRFVHEPIDTVADPKEALMALSIMLIRYLGIQLEERKKEIIGSSWCILPHRRGRNHASHVRQRHRRGCTSIKENSVARLTQGFLSILVNGNVHYSTRHQNISGRI
jgi:hypothetical protein